MFLFVVKSVATFSLMSCLMFAIASMVCAGSVDQVRSGSVELAQIIASAKLSATPGEQIVSISDHFINTPYVANTLIGGPQQPEQLVVDLAGLDCFTFLDAVEALRRSQDVDNFPEQLKKVRYFDGEVAYEKRRHFFSDWTTSTTIKDVTVTIGQGSAKKVQKQLNLRADGSLWLPGIAVSPQQLHYIPTAALDNNVLSALKPGDYVGVYSNLAGLDVSHTGLIVRTNGHVMLRHASSREGVERVVDEDLLNYMQGKPGLLVYRVKP